MNEGKNAGRPESLGDMLNNNVIKLNDAEDLIDGLYCILKGGNVEERPAPITEGLILNAIYQSEQLSRIVGKLTEISKLLA